MRQLPYYQITLKQSKFSAFKALASPYFGKETGLSAGTAWARNGQISQTLRHSPMRRVAPCTGASPISSSFASYINHHAVHRGNNGLQGGGGLRLAAARMATGRSSPPGDGSGQPVLLLDVMDTIVRDPFFTEFPRHFGISFKELMAAKHPTTWVEFERGELSEQQAMARLFKDERKFDHQALRKTMVRVARRYGLHPETVHGGLLLRTAQRRSTAPTIRQQEASRSFLLLHHAYSRINPHSNCPPPSSRFCAAASLSRTRMSTASRRFCSVCGTPATPCTRSPTTPCGGG